MPHPDKTSGAGDLARILSPVSPRRSFLKQAATLAGAGLLLPLSVKAVINPATGPQDALIPDGEGYYEITDWIRIDPDGSTILGLSQAECGQGVYTGLPQVLADELDADWQRVRVEFVTGRDAYRTSAANEELQQFVGASMSATLFYQRLRLAGAQAREALVAAAARKLGVRATQCATANGHVVHPQSGRSIGYGALVAEAATMPLNPAPRLKTALEQHLLGKNIRRLDTPAKTDGSARFGIDVQVPGMLNGAVRMAPTLNGRPLAIRNEEKVQRRPGVHGIVRVPDGVIVVADTYWQAKKAAEALEVEWAEGLLPDSDVIAAECRQALGAREAVAATHVGEPLPHLANPALRHLEADYETPYIVHATLESVNATVDVQPDRIEVWGPIQGQDKVRWTLAKLFALPPEKIIVHTTFLGGSFGRKYVPDFVVHAALASKAVGRPVKVIRAREEDMQHGMYRAGAAGRFRAVLNQAGYPLALHARVVGQSLYNVIKKDHYAKAGGWDETMLDGIYDMGYAIPNLLVDNINISQPVPISFLRTVGSTSSIFFLESFINELADLAGIDPVTYRQHLMAHDPLSLRVIQAAATRLDWFGSPPAKGVYRGFAFGIYTGRSELFMSYVAIALELMLEKGKVRIRRVVCSIDCGRPINPGLIRANVEGGIGFALTTAFKSRINFVQGRVKQSNFHDYELLKLGEMPQVEVLIMDSERPPQGSGEVALPPVAPAIAQALHRATGQHFRSMPFPQSHAKPA